MILIPCLKAPSVSGRSFLYWCLAYLGLALPSSAPRIKLRAFLQVFFLFRICFWILLKTGLRLKLDDSEMIFAPILMTAAFIQRSLVSWSIKDFSASLSNQKEVEEFFDNLKSFNFFIFWCRLSYYVTCFFGNF